MKTRQFEYKTRLDVHLLFAINKLIEELNGLPISKVNDCQASVLENSFSSAIILLSVVTLEAHVNVLSLQVENKASKTLTFLKGQIEHEEFEKLKELFVLRDLIAHNHLWSAKVCVENFDFTLLETHLFEGFGDNKYLEVIDRNRRETKILNFPIFPTRISRRDVFVLLKTISEVLQTLCIKYPETYDLLNFDFSTNTDQVTLKNLHQKLRGVSL